MPDAIYLDNNATSPILPEVAEAVRECMQRYHGNPASQHADGRAARRALLEANDQTCQLLGARTAGMDADRLIFTSGGGEANNLALRGLLRATANTSGGKQPSREPAHLIISAIEHPSVEGCAQLLESQGVSVDRAPVDAQGLVRVDALRALLRPATRLVSVMLANNETGVIQPVAEIAAVCSQHNIPVHTDATQAVGKMAVEFAGLGVAMMSFSAHKFHGPVGVGGLVARSDVPPLGLLAGQEGAERPGTAALALAVGMQRALAAWHAEADDRRRRMAALRDQFEASLLDALAGVTVLGGNAPRVPHTSNLAFVGLERQQLVMAFDQVGIACSTGSACASGSSQPSPVLLAMGVDQAVVDSAIRFSLGALTTEAEIREATGRIATVCQRLRAAK